MAMTPCGVLDRPSLAEGNDSYINVSLRLQVTIAVKKSGDLIVIYPIL